jgi:hypothetical protein
MYCYLQGNIFSLDNNFGRFGPRLKTKHRGHFVFQEQSRISLPQSIHSYGMCCAVGGGVLDFAFWLIRSCISYRRESSRFFAEKHFKQ